jgi:hypothetical protein
MRLGFIHPNLRSIPSNFINVQQLRFEIVSKNLFNILRREYLQIYS